MRNLVLRLATAQRYHTLDACNEQANTFVRQWRGGRAAARAFLNPSGSKCRASGVFDARLRACLRMLQPVI